MVIDQAMDPSFSTAVGLVMWEAEIRSSSGGGNVFAKFKSMDKVTGQVRKWLRSLIP